MILLFLSIEKEDFLKKFLTALKYQKKKTFFQKGIDISKKKSIILYVVANATAYARVAELADAHV